MTLPIEFQAQMKNLLRGEYESYLACLDEPPALGLRANTLKISTGELREIYPEPLAPVPWCESGFYYGSGSRPAKSPLYAAGLYYLQEPSAMAPASVLGVEPGDKVLDLCAAPGGKSTLAAARLKSEGILVSNDISATRCRALLKNLELCGAANAVVTNETPERLASRFAGYFDKILVDAPCSGEGMFRKDPDAVKAWSAAKADECRELQRSILFHASRMLAENGRLIYSTCTFSERENEDIIEEFLNRKEGFEIAPIDCGRFGFAESRLKGVARLWPHKLKGEGHFLAMIVNKNKKDRPAKDHPGATLHPSGGGEYSPPSEGDFPPVKENRRAAGWSLAGNDLQYFREFCAQSLNISFDERRLAIHGESLLLVPPELPSLAGLRVMRGGFYLGDIKTKRFEPSQALAMNLSAKDARLAVNFPLGGEYLSRYLRGESFECEAAEGRNLVCVEGFPLGWAKVKDGRLKNNYPKAWVAN